jgi:hypothetical protein
MSTLAMADKKGAAGQAGGKPDYTTFRIFAKDGEDLSELADKRKVTIAQLYHELFSEEVRRLLLDEAKKRVRELENRKN